MSDSLQGVSAGSVSPLAFDRRTINDALALLREYRSRRDAGNSSGGATIDPISPALLVYVRNDTSDKLPPLSVLKLGEPLIDVTEDNLIHECRQRPVLPGTAPTSGSDPFAVTLDRSEPSQVVRAIFIGALVIDVNVSDAAHGFAVPAAGVTASLASATSGPAKIVHKETGTGVKRAYVILAGLSSGSGISGIDVEDVDESPTVATVTQLRFDSADGFVVSSPGAGIARVDMQAASQTLVGVVNTSYQMWVEKGLEAVSIVTTLGATVGRVHTGQSIGGHNNGIAIRNNAGTVTNLQVSNDNISGVGGALLYQSGQNPSYIVFDSFTNQKTGVWATYAGLVFSGGILTSGSFAVSASDFSAQSANVVLAGPTSGGSATPTFRSLVNDDLPVVGLSKGGTAANLTNPGADRIFFWDTSAGATTWLQPDGTGIEISTTTLRLVNQGTVSDLTDNSGGTADGTLQALTDPADTPASADALRDDLVANLIPELRNNFADLAAKVNAILNALQAAGMVTA